MDWKIVDLRQEDKAVRQRVARLLGEAFRGRSASWQDPASCFREVEHSLDPRRISRIAITSSGEVIGWIGGFAIYDDYVWELHPIVVSAPYRRRGIGRALVLDLEQQASQRGGLTLWLGSDDENGETSLANADVYHDIPGEMRNFQVLRGQHPGEFYRRLGFHISGVLPNANGPGKPDIFFAKDISHTETASSAMNNADSHELKS